MMAAQPLRSNGRCLQSHNLAIAVVYLLISRSLPSIGSACHSTMSQMNPAHILIPFRPILKSCHANVSRNVEKLESGRSAI
jgi:hypothetical protein